MQGLVLKVDFLGLCIPQWILFFYMKKMNNNGLDISYYGLNPFYIVKLFHYDEDNENRKKGKKTDVKLVFRLQNFMILIATVPWRFPKHLICGTNL